MKKFRYLVVFLILFGACNEKVIEKPEDLIAREKMVDILFDLALINAGKAIDPNVMEENQIEPMSYVYARHGIDSAQFVKSDLYYAAIPSEYEVIYTLLEERLEAERLRLDEERVQKAKIDTTGYDVPEKVRKDIME
ncbi:DUF4296 domain-containing protein [Lentiprolixibacter aurantiacus]|uniref:DUF4296 domain-containing protein n=1 Tax=Lentiprolixibacter aurantiacus TaxID=2993939 RepID=A0AAE3MII8_9FLAO|nr:DUF4296 domain-containing protein [Lentiprolixibacter aurantiacus]MCX2718218.1 DUF4296 domain-containing protein [Lentiprolixibacter aurantiacus]